MTFQWLPPPRTLQSAYADNCLWDYDPWRIFTCGATGIPTPPKHRCTLRHKAAAPPLGERFSWVSDRCFSNKGQTPAQPQRKFPITANTMMGFKATTNEISPLKRLKVCASNYSFYPDPPCYHVDHGDKDGKISCVVGGFKNVHLCRLRFGWYTLHL